MRFDFALVGKGWASASLQNGGPAVRVTASYLGDALGDLLLAIWTLLDGDDQARCSWCEEPGEYRWVFRRSEAQVSFRVLAFPELWGSAPDSDGTVVFQWAGSLVELVSEFARGSRAVLSEYGADGYRETWVENDFPLATLVAIESSLAGDIPGH